MQGNIISGGWIKCHKYALPLFLIALNPKMISMYVAHVAGEEEGDKCILGRVNFRLFGVFCCGV